MFKKPYKVKTSTTVKASERKRLRNFVETSFPDLSPNDINELIPNKIEMNQVKAMTHSGSIAMIYCCGQNPIFFQVEDICYPTIYTLWKFPKLLPIVTTIPPVLEKISNGADLMAPGVVTDDYIVKDMNNLKPNEICAVRIIGNRAAVAVGKALLSSDELCQDDIKGKAVSIIHCYRDNLWLSGGQIDLPILPEEPIELPEMLENVNLSDSPAEDATNGISDAPLESDNHNAMNDLAGNEASKENEILPNYTMDEILHHSFFTALKVTGKKITLPILTSTFYSSHVLKSCPPDLNLDIKKTTYKKLSAFLKKMQKEGLVQIKELNKGVESIVSINLENESIKSYPLEPLFKLHLNSEKEKAVEEVPSSNIQGNYKFPLVTELYVISAQVKVLFEKYNLRKGDTVPVTTVREVLKRYAKENSLQNENNPREVVLDPILSDCIAKRGECINTMTWEQLQEAIVSKMPHAYQIEFENKDPIVKKGKLEPINVAIDTRTGNKKVTLITNLETYGINPEKLAQHVQVAVAASTSITPTQSGKGTLVLIQGNQVRYLQKLFLEKYTHEEIASTASMTQHPNNENAKLPPNKFCKHPRIQRNTRSFERNKKYAK